MDDSEAGRYREQNAQAGTRASRQARAAAIPGAMRGPGYGGAAAGDGRHTNCGVLPARARAKAW